MLDDAQQDFVVYSPGNTQIRNSLFDGSLGVRSYENSNSNADGQKLVSYEFDFEFDCLRAKVS